ncbi:MAG: primase [Planctomycetaceae bacterium]|nr:primase [Planctomycetaceae bacterium]
MVLVGTLAGILPSDVKPELVPTSQVTQEEFEELKRLAQDLSTSPAKEPDDDAQWGDLTSMIRTWTHDRLEAALRVLEGIDAHSGVLVQSPSSSPLFSIQSSSRGKVSGGHADSHDYDIRLLDGSRTLRPWQLVNAAATGERSTDRTEHIQMPDGRKSFVWTETRYRDRLLAVHVVQPGLAQLAGLGIPGNEAALQADVNKHEVPDTRFNRDANPIANTHVKQSQPPEDTVQLQSQSGDGLSQISTDSKSDISANTTDQILQAQEDSWRRRQTKAGNVIRIAMVQWQIEDEGSYRHPLFDVCPDQLQKIEKDILDSTGKFIARPSAWTDDLAAAHSMLPSSIEHRRRALLRQVLRACKHFDVECLLLPEYSTRPETVEWIQRELDANNLKTVVWAGTFRKPPYMIPELFKWLKEAPDWSAVFPLIIPTKHQIQKLEEIPKAIRTRCKKYPSIAYEELFNPERDALAAMTPDGDNPISRIIELICSEIFLATSPSNLHGLAWTWCDLVNKWGGHHQDYQQAVKDIVMQDVIWFADLTSMTSHISKRRTILFIPAMTPRSVDYAILGQANYLATGLTTVFCNDSGRHGHGQSCIIGHNCWDNEKDDSVPGIPNASPYHGVVPGLYRPRREDRGWLGQFEQAMVIADIDPMYQAEGKPRPQNLLPPLRLVAHLPILEVGSGQHRKLKHPDVFKLLRHKSQLTSMVYSKLNANQATCRKTVVGHIIAEISQVLSSSSSRADTVRDHDPAAIADCLEMMAYAIPENEYWLQQRSRAYKHEHASNPQRWPPPTLLDWLYVDIDKATNEVYPKIHVPPFARAASSKTPG